MTREHWQIRKAVERAAGGMVAAQSYRAAQVGARVLEAGGNAVDAAVATGFALAVVEPWMSGLGGGGCMLTYQAAERRVHAVDFAMVAPAALNPAAFPLAEGVADSDLFGWPGVVDDRNLRGPLSIAVPGAVDGFGLALERFGTLAWSDALAPAVALAHLGLPVDWWTTLKVAGEARALALDPAARATYLPGGLPPIDSGLEDNTLPLGALATTLEQLAAAGPRELYEGRLGEQLVRDVRQAGGVLSLEDLRDYHATVTTPERIERGDGELHVMRGLNAGPTLQDALSRLPVMAGPPGPAAYTAYAAALAAAYRKRFETLGHDGDTAGQGSTTHFSVIDRAGNMVACTNTLLSIFGAKLLSPATGILLNNGIMWFDPRPGGPNAIAPGARPLNNMCPVIATRQGAPWFALGASGGRRILPAVFQLTVFLMDCGLSLDAAVHCPRLNVDGGPSVQVDTRLSREIFQAVAARLTAERAEALVTPNVFASPQVVARDGAVCLGATQVRSPVAAAVGAAG